MTTIYAVNSGEYSDYGINGLFSTRENAEKYMEAFPKSGYGGYNDIEEWELDQYISEIDRGLLPFVVRMYKNGDVIEIMQREFFGEDQRTVHWMDKAHWNPPMPWANFSLWARDRDHAVKVANERRIRSLASPE